MPPLYLKITLCDFVPEGCSVRLFPSRALPIQLAKFLPGATVEVASQWKLSALDWITNSQNGEKLFHVLVSQRPLRMGKVAEKEEEEQHCRLPRHFTATGMLEMVFCFLPWSRCSCVWSTAKNSWPLFGPPMALRLKMIESTTF